MGKNLLTTFSLMMLFVFASCLPQEKTTQCGAGESYNSTQRRCIASLANSTDSISIASVTPSSSYAVSDSDTSKTHAITVSDPFNIGYSIRWYVTSPSGSTSLVATGTTYTFVHTAFTSGSYILEVQVLTSNGSSILDSRSWNVNIIDEVTPSLSTSTATPFSTTTTGGVTSINATASNPDAIANVQWQWYVNGNAINIAGTDSGSFNSTTQALSFDFDPSSGSGYFTGAGVYTVQVQLLENLTGVLYDSYTWTITNNIPGFASASLGTAVSGTASGNDTPNTAAIMTVLDETDIFTGGFKNDIDGDGNLDDIDFCVQINNNDAAVDETAGVDGNDIFVDFLENGVAIPNATNIQITAEETDFCLGDIVNAAGSTYSMDIPDSLTVESRTITAVVYDGYSGASSYPSYNGGTELTRYTWTNRVRQLNTPPVLVINDGADSTISSCTYSTTSATGCAITQDNTVQLAITVSDDDYDPDVDFAQFSVFFYLDGQLLDTAHPLSGSDCELNAGAAPTGTDNDTYICSLTINSYDSDGPIEDVANQSYTLTAVAYDTGSPYNLVDPKQSNTVTWQIPTGNLTASDTGATLTPFTDTAGAATATLETYLAEQSTPGVALNLNANSNIAAPQVTEGDNIVFNILVDDPERDSHYIRIQRCTDNTTTCATSVVVATKTVNSTDDTNPRDTQMTVNISEDAVIDDDIANVYYRVVIRTDSGSTTDLDEEVIYLSVANKNDDPTFNTANFSPALNTIGTEYIVYSGFPITLDAGAFADTSLSDGDTITYQWMVSVDNDNDNLVGDGDADDDYTPIEGATTSTLVWSPGSEIDYALQAGKLVSIKLCIGDDGWDNTNNVEKTPMNATSDDCLNATLDSGEWYFTGISNMYQGRSYGDDTVNNPSNGLADVWIDQEQFAATGALVKYFAYVNTDNEIIVEKIVTLADSSKGGSTEVIEEIQSITFPSTTDAGFAGNPVTYLSIAGDSTNKALYIAYMAEVATTDLMHVRRIDISGGKTGFTTHDGKFGFDPDYDDLSDNFTTGTDLTDSINASGQLEISVDADMEGNVAVTTISMQGLSGGGPDTLTEGVDFCLGGGACDDIDESGQAITDAINATTSAEWQGVTATYNTATNIITVDGIVQDDFLELDIGATAIGDIMINKTSGQWEIPYIDADRSSTDKFKISIYAGSLGQRLADSAHGQFVQLNGTVQSQELVNDILESDKDADAADDLGLADTDRILIAVKALSSGEIRVYEYDNGYALIESNTDLFSDNDVTELKLNISQNATNNNAYLVARNSSNAIAYARFEHTSGDFDMAGAEVILDLDNDFELIENDNASQFDVAAGTTDNQALFLAVDTANGAAYLTSIQSNGAGSATIDCSYDSDQDLTKCMPIQTQNGDNIFDLQVVLGDAVEGVTLGVDGDSAGEATNDIIPLIYHLDDGGGVETADAIPVLGIININGINFSNDNTNFGANYIIPYVND